MTHSLRRIAKDPPGLPVSSWPQEPLANKRQAFLRRGLSVSQLNVSLKLFISSNKFECGFLNGCPFPKVCLQKHSGFCYRHRIKDSVLQTLAPLPSYLHIIFLSLVVPCRTNLELRGLSLLRGGLDASKNSRPPEQALLLTLVSALGLRVAEPLLSPTGTNVSSQRSSQC